MCNATQAEQPYGNGNGVSVTRNTLSTLCMSTDQNKDKTVCATKIKTLRPMKIEIEMVMKREMERHRPKWS